MKFYPPGTRIAGRYEVASRPMMGGMGIVYICYDHGEDRPIALKTFKPEYLPDRAARDRFLREGTHWVDLGAHPHVVRCYEVERVGDGTEVYLALELVAKEQGRDDASLRAWLAPGHPLPPETAILFALQIARGMQHAAARIPGFVHRDLKPENILVGADHLHSTSVNRLRVTDFGLAAVLEGAAKEQGSKGTGAQAKRTSNDTAADPNSQFATPNSLRRTRLTRGIAGTPLYMAPEQWTGGEIGVWTDVYALGCILQEMLTGQHAASGRSVNALRQAHCAGDLHPLPSEISEPVRAIVAKCLALEPEARYDQWEEIETELVSVWETDTGHLAPSVASSTALSRAERMQAGWSYGEMGIGYMDIGKAKVAASYFERARAAGAAEGERKLEAAGLSNLGLAYAALGDVRRAVGFYEQALVTLCEIGDRRGEGTALGNLGSAYKNLGDARRAIGVYEQALAIAREIGDRRRESNDLGNLGSAYLQLGDARRAIDYYEHALAIDREIGDRRGEGNDLGNLGIAYKNLGDARRAIGYYEQALEIAREIGDRRGEGADLGNLGVAYADLGDTRRAIDYYEQQLIITREIGDRRGEGTALGNLGVAYKNLGDARRAIDYYEQALAILNKIGDRCEEGKAIGNLGVAYKDLGDARRAIDYYEQQLIITREIGDRRGEGTALGNLGVAYKNLGDIRRAIDYYEQQLMITREIGDRRGEGKAIGNLGNAYAELGNIQRAMMYYEHALAINREIGDVLTSAMIAANLAMAMAQFGQAAEAIPMIQQAIQDFRQAGYPQQAQKAERMLAQLQGGGAVGGVPARTRSCNNSTK
jgi:tetratricopeptide (TPR) repeat protein